jgi:hypothetical protein
MNLRTDIMTFRQITTLRNAFFSACLLIGLAACASTKAPILSEASDDQALKQFEAGDADLACAAACARAWQHSQSELSGLYESADWRALALHVLQINYRQDLGYFYLGRAAEELRRRAAALTYYRTAVDLATGPDESAKCAATATRCNELNLPTEALLRIQIVSAWHVSAVQARNAGRSAGSSHPNASNPWVDPPPVTP